MQPGSCTVTGTRDKWLRGDCVCCGAKLDWWPDCDAAPIAEGVMMCGRCIENGHHLDEGTMRFLLTAVLSERADEAEIELWRGLIEDDRNKSTSELLRR